MQREELQQLTRQTIADRVRAAVKAVLEQVIEEEITRPAGTRNISVRAGEKGQ